MSQAIRRRGFVKIEDLLNDETYTQGVAKVHGLLQGYLDKSGMDPDVATTFARVINDEYSTQKQMQAMSDQRLHHAAWNQLHRNCLIRRIPRP